MKRIHKIIITIFTLFIIFFCWIETQNLYLGSANYTKTIFSKTDSKWYCEEIEATLYVTKDQLTEYGNCAIVTYNEEKYIFRPRGHEFIDVYIDNDEFPPEVVKTIPVKYKKWLGEVYAFKISGIDKSNILLDGKDSLVFSFEEDKGTVQKTSAKWGRACFKRQGDKDKGTVLLS